jgi:hypothetical protein
MTLFESQQHHWISFPLMPSGEQGGCEMTVMFFLVRNSCTKYSEQVHYNGGETNPPNSTFQFNFAVYFSACVVNVKILVYSLLLWNKFIIHSSLWDDQWPCSSHLSVLISLFFFLVWRWWALPLRLLIIFWITPVNSSLITCDYLWKVFWASCKPLLKVLVCGDMFLLLLLT